MPTADLRFRRNEQIRIDVPTSDVQPMTGRLLDRTGKSLAVPIATAVRDDPDGSRWVSAQLALAPLAVGDYIVELTRAGGAGRAGRAEGAGRESDRMLVAFRVVP